MLLGGCGDCCAGVGWVIEWVSRLNRCWTLSCFFCGMDRESVVVSRVNPWMIWVCEGRKVLLCERMGPKYVM